MEAGVPRGQGYFLFPPFLVRLFTFVFCLRFSSFSASIALRLPNLRQFPISIPFSNPNLNPKGRTRPREASEKGSEAADERRERNPSPCFQTLVTVLLQIPLPPAPPRCDPALGFASVRSFVVSRGGWGIRGPRAEVGGGVGARAHEGPSAPHQGGSPAAAADDRAEDCRGPGRRALRRAVRLVVLPPRQCQVRVSSVPRACGLHVGGSRELVGLLAVQTC
jgi:hypothetical protein